MGIQTFPAPTITVPPALNTSQVFTTSGTFTVPAGVTSVFVRVRGGDGGRASQAIPNNTVVGTNGGTTSVSTISAAGGLGGWTSASNASGGFAEGQGPLPGTTVESFLAVTPGDSLTVTIGSGTGSHAIISWAV